MFFIYSSVQTKWYAVTDMVQQAGLRILNSFRQTDLKNFAELCEEAGYPTDLGGYYLRQLVTGGYLTKGERGQYILSPKGKAYLTHSHAPSDWSPRLNILIIATYDDELIVLQRNKQPFLNRKEWPASAIKNGETTENAIQRLLVERLTSATEVRFAGVFRKIEIYNDEVFDDKVFLVHRAVLGVEPPAEVPTGQNLHVIDSDVTNLKFAANSLLDILNFSADDATYKEQVYPLAAEDFEHA